MEDSGFRSRNQASYSRYDYGIVSRGRQSVGYLGKRITMREILLDERCGWFFKSPEMGASSYI